MKYIKLSSIVCFFLICSCAISPKSVADKEPFISFIGLEYVLEKQHFLSVEKAEYYVLVPHVEDDVIGAFIGAPTIKSFSEGSWDKTKYEGSFDYLDILATGTILRVVDVVERNGYGIGITYNYYAKILGVDDYSEIVVNINSLIDSKFRR